MPLYEYEHMLGWAEVQRHVAEEITLLCDQHHREKTSGLLPLEVVRQANESPFNLGQGDSKPYDLHYSGTECEAFIGGNRFTTMDAGNGTAMTALMIDDTPMLGFVLSEGHLLLQVNLFNEANELVLRIADNELVYSVSPWDVRLIGRRLEIREDLGQFLIEIEFEVPNVVRVLRGRFLRNGVEVLVAPDYALVTNNRTLISSNTMLNCGAGLVIGASEQEGPCVFRVTGVPRYWAGQRVQAVAWAEARLEERAARERSDQGPTGPTLI